MLKITSLLKNEQGSVIVIAIIILALLTIIGISATNMSSTEVKVSTNAMLHNIAFYAADSGIEAGRGALNTIKIADAASWENLLQVNEFTWNGEQVDTLDEVLDAEGGRTVGQTTFTLTVADNNDLDGNDQIDTDDTVLLTSTATYSNATVTIETIVRGGGEAYAQEHYNAGSSGDALSESVAVTANKRW